MNKKTIGVYIIIYTLIFIAFNGLFIYSKKQETYNRLSNRLYGENLLEISSNKEITWNKFKIQGNYSINLEIHRHIRAVIKTTSKWKPPMLSGYVPNELKSKNAVVGKIAMKNATINKEG